MRLFYTANARIPSEKAHAYQIVQMCEALAAAGADVTLLYAGRRNRPSMQTDDIWGYYGVERRFSAERLGVIDLYLLAERLPGRLARLADRAASVLAWATYHVSLARRLAREPQAVIYTRNALTLGVIAALWPRRARRSFFEAHTFPASRVGLCLRRWLAGRVGGVVALTDHLRQRHAALGVPGDRLLTAHDGVRLARFALHGDGSDWRAQLGWPPDAFVVGYLGRFVSGLEGMDKGLATLVEAAILLAGDAAARPVRLALVGGPESFIRSVETRLEQARLPRDFLLYPGMVPADQVPGCLQAFDVCTIPSPWNDFFAYYSSPMKLFEYMAASRPIVASDLPSVGEVLRDEENALLVAPSDPGALAAALRRLRDDPALADRLAHQAAQDVAGYTWEARARRILAFIVKSEKPG